MLFELNCGAETLFACIAIWSWLRAPIYLSTSEWPVVPVDGSAWQAAPEPGGSPGTGGPSNLLARCQMARWSMLPGHTLTNQCFGVTDE